MPPIETERLLIRTLEPEDSQAMRRVLAQSFGRDPSLQDAQAVREHESWLQWSILSQVWLPKMHQPPYGDRAVVLKATGSLIGAIGYVPLLAPFDQIPQLQGPAPAQGLYTAEVGLYWVIAEEHRRRGYAHEAARALVVHAFKNMHVKRILATTEDDNQASQAVMRKLGMELLRNPWPEPPWLQVVGVLWNPA